MGLGTGFWLTVIIGAAIGIFIEVLFLLNLRNLLRQVSPENRAMNPDYVWLVFIPLFNFVWIFVMVVKIRDSVRADFQSRNWAPQGDFGFGAGITYAIFMLLSAVVSQFRIYVNSAELSTVSAIAGVIGVVGFVCWVVYWVRTNGLKQQLMRAGRAVQYAPASPYGAQAAPGATYPQAAVRLCPSCGAAVYVGDVYCRSCGVSTEAAAPGHTEAGEEPGEADDTVPGGAVCPFCATPYRANARFCSSCGRPAV